MVLKLSTAQICPQPSLYFLFLDMASLKFPDESWTHFVTSASFELVTLLPRSLGLDILIPWTDSKGTEVLSYPGKQSLYSSEPFPLTHAQCRKKKGKWDWKISTITKVEIRINNNFTFYESTNGFFWLKLLTLSPQMSRQEQTSLCFGIAVLSRSLYWVLFFLVLLFSVPIFFFCVPSQWSFSFLYPFKVGAEGNERRAPSGWQKRHLASPRLHALQIPSHPSESSHPSSPSRVGLLISGMGPVQDELTVLSMRVYEQQTVGVNTAKPSFIHNTYYWFFSN